MPVKAEKRKDSKGEYWVVVEATTGQRMSSSGTFRGSDAEKKAKAQAAKVNMELKKRGKI